jgi:hypothetical protein
MAAQAIPLGNCRTLLPESTSFRVDRSHSVHTKASLSGLMSYTAAATAEGYTYGKNKSISADDTYQWGWLPEYSDYDQIASNAQGVVAFDVPMIKQATTPNDTHYKFFGVLKLHSNPAHKSQSYAKKIPTPLDSLVPSLFDFGADTPLLLQDPYPNRVPDPSTATAYAKKRLRMFDLRAIKFNAALVKAYTVISESPNPLDTIEYTIRNEEDEVVYETSRPSNVEVILPVLDGDGDYAVTAEGCTTETFEFSASGANESDAGTLTLYPVNLRREAHR